MSAEVVRLAQNLACNCGYAVLPVGENKHPTRPKSEGGEGCKDASTDPERIAWMWDRWPGPLIGIATGKASGISVLDVDRKHAEAVLWWQGSHMLLLPTRTYATRSGGLHLYFRHCDGVTNTQGKICRGVDSRGAGGYVISWFAHGLDCFDQTPPQPWPAWLLEELTRRPAPSPQPGTPTRPYNDDRSIDGIVRRLAAAREGERNGVLYWATCRCVDRGMRECEIAALLVPPAISIGLPDIEVRRTIGSATGGRAA